MLRTIEVDPERTPEDYATDPVLRQAVEEMRTATADDVDAIDGRKIWMVNSTASGGGVAEMMEMLVGLVRSLGAAATWAVIEVDDADFFEYTKNIHNLLHNAGDPERLAGPGKDVYERQSRTVADTMVEHLTPDDILCVHDPQPLAAGAYVVDELGLDAVWRCHIGSETQSPESDAAWEFLDPYIDRYDRTVFSLPEYVPPALEGTTDIIPPAIDPESPKNRYMKPQEVASVLARADLVDTEHPVEEFGEGARRLQGDGSFGPATEPEDLGILFRPTLVEISRWDRLKGFVPLLEGFAAVKEAAQTEVGEPGPLADTLPASGRSEGHRERIADARLLLVGPDPSSVSDDPEGQETLAEIETAWQALDDYLKEDVAVVVMPPDQYESALVINALQRAATIVVQNSLQEGFGLTVTEAMWKRAVMVGSDTGGISAQVEDGENGLLIPDASDPASVARTLDEAFERADEWDDLSLTAHRNVTDDYLVFGQVTNWLDTIGKVV